jgi:hypothetical protein
MHFQKAAQRHDQRPRAMRRRSAFDDVAPCLGWTHDFAGMDSLFRFRGSADESDLPSSNSVMGIALPIHWKPASGHLLEGDFNG